MTRNSGGLVGCVQLALLLVFDSVGKDHISGALRGVGGGDRL